MKHYKTVHLKVKDYKCPVCGVLFGEKGNLKKHIRAVHEGKYPHKCEFENCTKSFTRSENLRRHVTTVHRMIKSYVCDYEGCGKRFGEKGHLTQHKAIHSDNKRYKCPYECPFATYRNCNLVEHIKKKHRVEEVIDRACDSLHLPFVCKASEKYVPTY